MLNYRTIDDVIEEYLRNHPDEVDDYVSLIFEEYAQDGDAATLLSFLHIICRVKGVSLIAEGSDLSRNGVPEASSEDDHPELESLNAIMYALGYRLAPLKLQTLN